MRETKKMMTTLKRKTPSPKDPSAALDQFEGLL
jgi:hypothetical protein